jgi:hypothetical protein
VEVITAEVEAVVGDAHGDRSMVRRSLHLYGCDAPSKSGETFYRQHWRCGEPHGMYSQWCEDSILNELVTPLGPQPSIVDIGAHDGVWYSNSRRIIEAGGRGVLIETDEDKARACAELYADNPNVSAYHAHADALTIEAFLDSTDIGPRPDVVSIDVDGQDIWIMAGLGKYQPRILVVEFAAVDTVISFAGPGLSASLVPELRADAPWINENTPCQAGPVSVGMAAAALGYRWVASTFVNMIFVDREYMTEIGPPKR